MQHTTQEQSTFATISPALKRYALRLTHDEGKAEDLVQDTYISMLTRKKEGAGIERPEPYMMSVMHNLFIDKVRRLTPENRPVPLDDVEPVALDAPQSLKLACQETILAMDRLPSDLREVLVRHACQGQSYTDIAKALDIPIGTVMSRIARARGTLCRVMDMESGRALWEDG